MAEKKNHQITVELPSGVSATYANEVLTVTGKAGAVSRPYKNPQISVTVNGQQVVLQATSSNQREKMHIRTLEAHIKNMIAGAQKPYSYELKICSGHFPMTAALKGSKFELKNFLGEQHPRSLEIKPGAKVTVSGAMITVEATDKELAGRVASDLEQLTRIANRDRRIFQDGIYMTKKAGKPV
ncbi:MAG TPA: 50S ribosomal protein L6 [Acidobacteriota bacterium]|nr:50S ribosomal protein L6 [Acidobacteriota bacterium]